MQDAIADTNNSAPDKDRLSYNMFKHLSEKTLSIFLLFINKIWFLQEIPKDIVMIIIFSLLFMCFKLTTVVVSTTDFTEIFSK
jgi:hypothetical protein